MADAEPIRCVHCLQPLIDKTADHVFPKSWYPDTTPGEVQRWTVPSCEACNSKIGAIERELLIKLGLCVDPRVAEASGISAKALRSLGINTQNLSAQDKFHRQKKKEKVLAEMKSYSQVAGRPGILPGFGFHEGFPKEIQSAVLVSEASLIAVSTKIARGLEFKLTGRYVDPPYRVDVYFVDEGASQKLKDLFERSERKDLGPGFEVFRKATNDDPKTVLYRMIIWQTLVIHVCITDANRQS